MFDPLRQEIPPVQSCSEQTRSDRSASDKASANQPAATSVAESRFFQAMEQIRTLKKAGGSNAAE